jgi:hypothetical protein
MKSRTLTLIVCALMLGNVAPAHASFHLMQIQQVIGGVDGDLTAQAIQLRMRSSFQNLVSGAQIRAWDATGSNPVVIIAFPSNVTNHGLGVPILIASAAFAGVTTPAAVADFTMTNVIPSSYLAAGSLTFENALGTTVYWRLSWGNYTGATTGSVTNDFDGEFGPAFPSALSSGSDKAVLFLDSASAMSSDNFSDYSETAGAAVFMNNTAASFTVTTPTDAVPSAAFQQLRSRPNPFNPMTEIVFSSTRTEHFTLAVYDPRGRLVTTLLQGMVSAGTHRLIWDGTNSEGHQVASGIYLARLSGANRLETHKLVLGK